MSVSTKTKQLATDTLLFSISTFGSKILIFLLTPLYTAVLLTEEYGLADLINATVHLVYPILTLAISDATLRYALEKGSSPKAVLGNSLFITAISLLILLALSPVVTCVNLEFARLLSEYWIYFILIYAMYNFHLCISNFIKGSGQTKLFAIQGIVQTASIIICNIYFLLIAKNGLQGYLLSLVIGYAVPTVLMFVAGKIYRYAFPLKTDKKLMLEMLKYSIPMIPTLLAWSINMYINKYMLIGLLPVEEGLSASGIFSVANKIPSVLTTVLSIFTQAWQLSAISNVSSADEDDYYTKVYHAMHIISLAGCLVIIPFSKLASSVLFDASYFSAWQHIPFLTLSAFFSCLSAFLASAFRAYKQTGKLFVSVAIGAIVNIIANLVFIKTIGVVGASLATATSFFVTWLVRIITIQHLVKLKINIWKTLATYVLVFSSSFMITFDISYANVYYLLLCAVTLLLNLKDLKHILIVMFSTIKKILKR